MCTLWFNFRLITLLYVSRLQNTTIPFREQVTNSSLDRPTAVIGDWWVRVDRQW